jgi:hypothetical protein
LLIIKVDVSGLLMHLKGILVGKQLGGSILNILLTLLDILGLSRPGVRRSV